MRQRRFRCSPIPAGTAPCCPVVARCTASRPQRPTCSTSLEELVEALGAARAKPALQQKSVPAPPDGPLTVEKHQPRRGCGPARRRDRLRRNDHVGDVLAGQHRGGSEARLAHSHGRRDRSGAARGGWGGDRVSGSAGHRPSGRWLGAVHHPVALDDGARTAQCHRRDLQQPCLRDTRWRACARAARASPGRKAKAQLDLGDPDIDFVALGTGLGIASRRVETAEELSRALPEAIADPGPHLIEAVIPPRLQANCLRSSVFLNLPVAVRGIAATNSIRSGSCHFAKSRLRCSRSSSGLASPSRRGGRPRRAAARPIDRRERQSLPPPRRRDVPSTGSRGRPKRSIRRRT